MWRFGIKTALVGGAVYYTAEQGLWRDSETTSEIYKNLKTEISPYVADATKKIPFEIPELPNTDRITYLGKYYWNSGVKSVFGFLIDLPSNSVKWTTQGMTAISKFVDTQTTQQEAPENPKK